MKRKRYTPEFKSQVVLEVLKEEKTMNEIASSHEFTSIKFDNGGMHFLNKCL
ncbi:transposase [Bacillus chungangensis]|uniref:transposase n=1 Tax=Bacillus chungangensis TaxID=587633 RepID=UPI00351FA1AD